MVPVVFAWRDVEVVDADGVATRAKAMVPLARYGNVAARQFSEGEEYPLVVLEARTRASHSHYFAALNEAFENLPEKVAARWPTVEHFRKWALIETGWFDEEEFDCPDEPFARKLGAFIRKERVYARITVHRVEGAPTRPPRFKVIVREAQSQSTASMAKQRFEDSKRDVLDYAAGLTGVRRGDYAKQAGRSA